MAWTTKDLADHYQRQGMKPPDAIAAACDNPKPTKYRSKAVLCNGIMFDSRAEALFYQGLLIQQAHGHITDLELQPHFILQAAFTSGKKKVRAIGWKADFQFRRDGKIVIVDVKSRPTITQQARLRHKMFLAQYPNAELELWARAKGNTWEQL
jgi:hypothetical protein